MTEKEKMRSGKQYNPEDSELVNDRINVKTLCQHYNALLPHQKNEKTELLRKILGQGGENCTIEPDFFCDYGYNIKFEGFVYINHNSVFLDCAEIRIGENTFIGPNCGFYTAIHPIKAEERIKGLETAKPITIGKNVWIGGNAVILAGVVIGDNAVIGAGAVVTKNIPANSIAVGNPCRVIKQIEQ